MAYLTATAQNLATTNDWSQHTIGELHEALLESTVSTLPDAVEGRNVEDYIWIDACRPNIDFLIYVYCDPLGIYPEEISIEEIIKEKWNEKLDANTKRNLFYLYSNVYLYKYISIERDTLLRLVRENRRLTKKQAVEHFISYLVYYGLAENNPRVFLGFENLDMVPEGRKASFRPIRDELLKAIDTNDQVALFKNIFYLMTYFAGSEHRRVHDAFTTIFGIDMATFREMFYENLPGIIERGGTISVGWR